MTNRELLIQRVHEIRKIYKDLTLEKIVFFDDDERKRVKKLFMSLPFFAELVCDALDNNMLLTDVEIGVLDDFINSLFAILDSKEYESAIVSRDDVSIGRIYNSISQLADAIDNIKPIVRGFYVHRSDILENTPRTNEIKALILKAQNMQESFTSKLAILDEKLDMASQIIGTTTAKLDDITKHQETLKKVGGKYQNTLSILDIESESLLQKKNDLAAAHELLDGVRSTYQANDNVLKELNKELSKLQSNVLTMESRAKTIEDELNQKTDDIDLIIEQANAALETSTTVSVGTFFKEQYDIAKKWMPLWPSLALVFLVGAIWICIDTLQDIQHNVLTISSDVLNVSSGTPNSGAELPYLIARLCIVPLFLLGVWFCSSQYIKQKNITEDYAYKKVLSLSLIGFKSEIEKTGEANTTGFIKTLLKEILRSPLETLDKKHYKRETKLLKLAHDEMISNMFKNVTSKKSEPDEDKK
ncbi:TPA: hypothetical protein ACSTJZ_001376 [Serratia fonticola]